MKMTYKAAPREIMAIDKIKLMLKDKGFDGVVREFVDACRELADDAHAHDRIVEAELWEENAQKLETME